MDHAPSLITEFLKTMEHAFELHKLELIDDEEFRFTKIAAINITLYSSEHYDQDQMEEAIMFLHNSGIITKEEYWQIKARLSRFKNAA